MLGCLEKLTTTNCCIECATTSSVSPEIGQKNTRYYDTNNPICISLGREWKLLHCRYCDDKALLLIITFGGSGTRVFFVFCFHAEGEQRASCARRASASRILELLSYECHFTQLHPSVAVFSGVLLYRQY